MSDKNFFLYHGTDIPDLTELKPQLRYTPGKAENLPPRIYASSNPAYSIAHSFPWESSLGFQLYIDANCIIFRIPKMHKHMLEKEVYLYQIAATDFTKTLEEKSGYTYHSNENVKLLSCQKFANVIEAFEHFGGLLEFY